MKKKYWVGRDSADDYCISTSAPVYDSYLGYFQYPLRDHIEGGLCGSDFRKFFGIKKSDLRMSKCAEFEFDIKTRRIK